jgi:hypothetical protein
LGMVSKRTQSRRRRAEKAEPLLRDHDGHGGGDIVVGARDQQPAQVEHRVDVAAAGVRHGHDVARRRRRLVWSAAASTRIGGRGGWPWTTVRSDQAVRTANP